MKILFLLLHITHFLACLRALGLTIKEKVELKGDNSNNNDNKKRQLMSHQLS